MAATTGSVTVANEDHYFATREAYQKNSDVEKRKYPFVEEVATSVMANIVKDDVNSSSSVFRVLGVGSGDGRSDLRILTAVAMTIESCQIHATIIEPDGNLMPKFRSRVSSLAQPLEGKVTFEWHETTFEKFVESCSEIDRCFDLIHFITSLYYVEAEEALSYCYKRLAPGGALFCILGCGESFFPKMSRKLEGKCTASLGSTHKFYSEMDLVSIAKRNNWKYEELCKTHYTVDITSCFDDSSIEGGLLLDFMTHCQDFRSTADRTFQDEVMNFLNEESTTDDNGNKLVKPEITAVVIYK